MLSRSKMLRYQMLVLIICVSLITGGIIFGSWSVLRVLTSALQSIESKPVITEPAFQDSVTSLSSKILFMGDTFWGRKTNVVAQQSPLKDAYPFSRLNEFGRENYDAWIANLECPSVPGLNQPYNVEVNSLIFNCPTNYLPEAAKWFTAFSLANNHIGNQGGEKGVVSTRNALEANGIQYFGDYDPERLEDVCEIISVQARVKLSSGTEQKTNLPIALCGYHGLSTTPSKASLAEMQKYAKYMPVFAYPHMGVEYTATPTSGQTNLYRAMIDNGADAVFGGHPHWVQTSEVYKKKLIIYSMGDFLFDQGPGETQRGAAIKLTLQLPANYAQAANLKKWEQVGANCKTFHDDCLATIQSQGLTKLPLTFHYDLVGVSATKTPSPATDAESQLIKTRLGWNTVGPQINETN